MQFGRARFGVRRGRHLSSVVFVRGVVRRCSCPIPFGSDHRLKPLGVVDAGWLVGLWWRLAGDLG